MENTPNLADISKNLSGLSILDKLKPDITGGCFNSLIKETQMLIFLLIKTSIIPMINYNDLDDGLNKTLGLTNDQFTNIINLNNQLLVAQKMIQMYCVQNIVLNGLIEEQLGDVIGMIPEETNINSINQFMNLVEAFKESESSNISETQVGGINLDDIRKSLARGITAFLGIASIEAASAATTISPTSQVSIQISSIDTQNGLGNSSLSMMNYSPNTTSTESGRQQLSEIFAEKGPTPFTSALQEYSIKILENTPNIKRDVNISQAIDYRRKYQENERRKTNTLVQLTRQATEFIGMLQNGEPSQTGEQLFIDMSYRLNEKTSKISTSIQNSCMNIIEKFNRIQGFEKIYDYNTAETTRKQIQDQINVINQSDKEIFSEAMIKTSATVLYSFFGDFTAAFLMGENAIETINNLSFFKSTEKSSKEMTPITLTPDQINDLSQYNYKRAKIACNFGYNLEIDFNKETKTLQVIGGRIEYDHLKYFIDTLKKNVELQILMNKSGNEAEIINSVNQRLQILSEITDSISDFINSHGNVIKDVKSFSRIDDYYGSEISKINKLASYLELNEPVKARYTDEKKINQEQKLARSSNETDMFFKQASEIVRANSKGITETIFSAPRGGIEGISNQSVNTVITVSDQILTGIRVIFSKHYVVLISMFLTLLMACSGSVLKFVYKGVDYVLYLPKEAAKKSLAFLYQVVTTPFGFTFKLIKVFLFKPKQDITNGSNQAALPGDNPAIPNGSIKKTRRKKKPSAWRTNGRDTPRTLGYTPPPGAVLAITNGSTPPPGAVPAITYGSTPPSGAVPAITNGDQGAQSGSLMENLDSIGKKSATGGNIKKTKKRRNKYFKRRKTIKNLKRKSKKIVNRRKRKITKRTK